MYVVTMIICFMTTEAHQVEVHYITVLNMFIAHPISTGTRSICHYTADVFTVPHILGRTVCRPYVVYSLILSSPRLWI